LGGVAALGLVIGFETPSDSFGLAWLVRFLLLQLGFGARLPEFRWQGYTAAVASWTALVAVYLLGKGAGAWKWLAVGAAISIRRRREMV